MREPIVIVGQGEMGGVFARGLLKLGHPIYPVLRDTDIQQLAAALPQPRLVLVAVGEKELHPTLEQIPTPWRGRLALLQNELLPMDWQHHQLPDPTVIAVWFEKKVGQEVKLLLPSPLFGPEAALLAAALDRLAIPTRQLPDAEALRFELVGKNLYILTTNLAGLVTGGTVSQLWEGQRELALEVAGEVLDLQQALAGPLDRPALLALLEAGIASDPNHQCTGRSAPARLARCLAHADRQRLALPRLRAIAAQLAT